MAFYGCPSYFVYLTLGIVTLNPVLCHWYICVVIEKQDRMMHPIAVLIRSELRITVVIIGSSSGEILRFVLSVVKDSSRRDSAVRLFFYSKFLT